MVTGAFSIYWISIESGDEFKLTDSPGVNISGKHFEKEQEPIARLEAPDKKKDQPELTKEETAAQVLSSAAETETNPTLVKNSVINFAEIDQSMAPQNQYMDATLTNHGVVFRADLQKLASLATGQNVNLKLFEYDISGVVEKNIITKRGNRYVKLDIESKRPGTYMTYHEGRVIKRGKIFMEDKAYMYEYDKDGGYMMEIFEYKKLNNALEID